MPITKITEETLEQVCANCDKNISLSMSNVSVGVSADEDYIDDSVIRLPRCPDCGSVEFLFRSPENEPEFSSPGSHAHLHRLLVDLLHAKLVKQGNVQEGLDPKKVKTRPPDKETISRWFKEGLVLERAT
jgi:hypothetical protein